MKEEINLLAPSVKTARNRQILWSRGNYIWRRVVLTLSIILIVLGVGYGLFSRNKHLFEVSLMKNLDTDTKTQQAVSTANEFLKRFETRVNDTRLWSPDIVDVLKVMPTDIQLTEINARESDGALIIMGVTPTRSSVVDFQRRLEKISWIRAVEAPLNNFATESSGSFTFTLFPKERKKI